MSGDKKTILYLDLKKRTSEVKVHADFQRFIGGAGLAYKLLSDLGAVDPVIFAVGPFNSYYPFVSKVCTLFYDVSGRLVESYGGGRFGLILSFTTFDAVVIVGESLSPVTVTLSSDKVEISDREGTSRANLEYSWRSSRIRFEADSVLVDDIFYLDPRLGTRLSESNLESITVRSDRPLHLGKLSEYKKIYREILVRGKELSVPYDRQPSCGGCPAGCQFSRQPEFDPALTLSYCLVACSFAKSIFEDLPTVFSLAHVLGYDFSHEQLEKAAAEVARMRVLYAHR